MDKRVEFHQAQITVVVKVVDDERSHGMHQLQYQVLMDTDAEWESVRELMHEQIAQLQEQLDGDSEK